MKPQLQNAMNSVAMIIVPPKPTAINETMNNSERQEILAYSDICEFGRCGPNKDGPGSPPGKSAHATHIIPALLPAA